MAEGRPPDGFDVPDRSNDGGSRPDRQHALRGRRGNDYASCVAANEGIPPVDFDFAGGKLGVIANDLAAGDNTTGESAGGVSPTWRITFLSACR